MIKMRAFILNLFKNAANLSCLGIPYNPNKWGYSAVQGRFCMKNTNKWGLNYSQIIIIFNARIEGFAMMMDS